MSGGGNSNIKNIGHYFKLALELAPADHQLYEVYERELPVMVRIIDDYIETNELDHVHLCDFGGGNGGVTEYIKQNSRYKDHIHITCIDANPELLADNHSAHETIQAQLTEYSSPDKFDVMIMRYVLEFNNVREQLQILRNIQSSLTDTGIFINWRCAVRDTTHQQKFHTLLSTPDIYEKLYRPDSHWDTLSESLELFEQAGLSSVVKDSYSSGIMDVLEVKYSLSRDERTRVAEFLGEYNYLDFVLSVSNKQP